MSKDEQMGLVGAARKDAKLRSAARVTGDNADGEGPKGKPAGAKAKSKALPAAPKAKAKAAAAKAKAKASAAKAKAKAKAKASAAKAKAKASAKAKAEPWPDHDDQELLEARRAEDEAGESRYQNNRCRGKTWLTIDHIMRPEAFGLRLRKPLRGGEAEDPSKPALKRREVKRLASPAPKKAPRREPAAAADQNLEGLSREARVMIQKELVPHTFAGRARPSKGWACEKYCRVANTFRVQLQPRLQPKTKNKAQAGERGTCPLF